MYLRISSDVNRRNSAVIKSNGQTFCLQVIRMVLRSRLMAVIVSRRLVMRKERELLAIYVISHEQRSDCTRETSQSDAPKWESNGPLKTIPEQVHEKCSSK